MIEFLFYLSVPVVCFLLVLIIKELRKEKVQEVKCGRSAWWHD